MCDLITAFDLQRVGYSKYATSIRHREESAWGRLDGQRPAAVSLAVGPEGGFAGDEVERAVEAGWLPAGLGPRILRTETAGIVATALVLARWGDLA